MAYKQTFPSQNLLCFNYLENKLKSILVAVFKMSIRVAIFYCYPFLTYSGLKIHVRLTEKPRDKIAFFRLKLPGMTSKFGM